MNETKQIITLDDVKNFLSEFKVKASIFGIRYRNDRIKNSESLFKLGITPVIRERIVFSIEGTDYSEGPIINTLNNDGDMWVFGKDYNEHEIYIKISMTDSKTVCISFHESEYPMKYPLKPKQ